MWLIEQQAYDSMVSQSEGYRASSFQLDRFGNRDDNLVPVKDGVAQIDIKGVLTPEPDIFAFLFGGGNTTYSELMSSIAVASANPDVTSITFEVDSPGGDIDGLFAVMDAIKAIDKPTKAVVLNKAASAAFGLVAQMDEITAFNRASSFGSIGVVTSGRIQKDVVTITSTNAPFKRPDIATEVGQAVVRANLDEIEELFIASIASGRNVQSNTVIADFGKGAMFLAGEAMRRGMIDAIGDGGSFIPSKQSGGSAQAVLTPADKSNENPTKAKAMDITKLKAEFPAVYDQVFALGQTAGVDLGTSSEKKRVEGHLEFGKQFGAMDLALKCVEDGSPDNDMKLMAQYMATGRNNEDIAASGSDANDVDPGTVATSTPVEAADEDKDKETADAIMAMAATNLGVDASAATFVAEA
jgi:ClpP class serine protease